MVLFQKCLSVNVITLELLDITFQCIMLSLKTRTNSIMAIAFRRIGRSIGWLIDWAGFTGWLGIYTILLLPGMYQFGAQPVHRWWLFFKVSDVLVVFISEMCEGLRIWNCYSSQLPFFSVPVILFLSMKCSGTSVNTNQLTTVSKSNHGFAPLADHSTFDRLIGARCQQASTVPGMAC